MFRLLPKGTVDLRTNEERQADADREARAERTRQLLKQDRWAMDVYYDVTARIRGMRPLEGQTDPTNLRYRRKWLAQMRRVERDAVIEVALEWQRERDQEIGVPAWARRLEEIAANSGNTTRRGPSCRSASRRR